MKTTIYMDHAATTQMHPEVYENYIENLQQVYGNPSSIHHVGRQARKELDDARKQLATMIGAKTNEIIFTSGGTEADNYAIIGTAYALKNKGNHIITTAIEHHAVLNTCKQLEKEGFRVTYLDVDSTGRINASQVQEALTDETILVSIMFGNNEVGSIQPIAEIGALLKEHQAQFHTDAVQAFGVVPLHVEALGVDLLSASSHKTNGPKGVGFLFQRKGAELFPLLYGGEQERKRRAGTENVPAIIAFSNAARLAHNQMIQNNQQYTKYEQIICEVLKEQAVEFELNGPQVDGKLPHIVNISFPGTDIEALLVNLDLEGVAVSSGSACTAGSLEPSHVLAAMFGTHSSKLRNSVRFSFGYGLTTESVRDAAYRVATVVNRLVKR